MSSLVGEAMGKECSRVDVQMAVFGDGEVVARFHCIGDQCFGGDVGGAG